MKFKSDIEVQAGLKDSSGSVGTSGQVLSTTATGVSWITVGVGGYVPYTGATGNVDLGNYSLTSYDLIVNHASGSGTAASITKGGNGEALTVVKTSGSGNAASITGGTTLISELNLTTDLADAYIASAATWNAKQNALNGTGFVKISGTTISYDNSTYAPTSRTITINGVTQDLSANQTWTIAGGVTSFNTRTGAITLTSSDVTTALGYTPVTNARTITINGVAQDLSADRSWTVTSPETDTLATVVARGDTTNGGRPIRLDTSGGGVYIKGSSGGWATGYYFTGSSNTYRGGFGALGDTDGLSNYWIGPAYNNYYTYIDSSQMSHTSSLRAPIFYDSNNTGYYVDPASISNVGGIIANNWFRVIGQTGLYSETYGNHFYSRASNKWGITGNSGSGDIFLDFYGTHQTTYRGSVHADTNNSIGFLTNDGGWGLRITTNKNAYFHGNTVYIGADGQSSSNIIMQDGDEGDRQIHCNSNRIGFLTQAGAWGSYCTDNGDWVTDMISWAGASMRAPIFYDSNNTGFYVDPASTSQLNTIWASKTVGDNVPAIQIRGGSGGPRFQTYGLDANSIAWMGLGTDMGGNSYEHSIYFPTWPGGTSRCTIGDYNGATYNTRFTVLSNGTSISSGDSRAPIFYDYNDTSYYTDLASTSQTATRQRGGTLYGPNTTWGAYLLVGGNGRTDYYNNATVASVVSTDGNLHLDAGSGKSMYFNWYDGGAIIFGNGSESQIGYMSSAGDFTANSSSRAPIFYDTNNTGYYLDPASTSNLNVVQAAGGFFATSDKRIKENIVTIDKALDKVTALRGVYYHQINSEDKKNSMGVIAQEVLEVVPEVVGKASNGMYNVAYGNLAGLFIEAIKEQQAQIEELKQLVNKLINK